MAAPYIMVELDKPRRLRFAMREMWEFEQATGLKMAKLDEMPEEDLIDVVSKIFFHMLKFDNREITFEESLEIASSVSFQELMEIVSKVRGATDPKNG